MFTSGLGLLFYVGFAVLFLLGTLLGVTRGYPAQNEVRLNPVYTGLGPALVLAGLLISTVSGSWHGLWMTLGTLVALIGLGASLYLRDWGYIYREEGLEELRFARPPRFVPWAEVSSVRVEEGGVYLTFKARGREVFLLETEALHRLVMRARRAG